MNLKILPGTFFLLSKEKALNNFQQNVDSEKLLIAIIKKDILPRKILKKNEIDIKKTEKELISLLNSKPKMKNKQNKLYISRNTP